MKQTSFLYKEKVTREFYWFKDSNIFFLDFKATKIQLNKYNKFPSLYDEENKGKVTREFYWISMIQIHLLGSWSKLSCIYNWPHSTKISITRRVNYSLQINTERFATK